MKLIATGPHSPASVTAMKAIQVQKTGGPEVLTLVDLPVPEPKPNEALVKVSAAGVNFIDIYFRQANTLLRCRSWTARKRPGS